MQNRLSGLFLITLTLSMAQTALAQTSARLDEAALRDLRTASERAHSDAVLILRDGKPIAEWYSGETRRPVELMSVLKSVVAIGIGRLLELGKIDSLDQPVHAFYPEWNQGRKKEITLRHLLNHTSGLQDIPNAGAEIYPSPDAVRLALAAELSEAPGSAFRYNNKATNLLAGIIEKAYGQRMDQFFVNELLRPMDIDEYKWYYDQSGTPHAMAGLELHARDLAKFGQLVLDGGSWDGKRLVAQSYIKEMLAQGQPYRNTVGLLWWRLPAKSGEIVAWYGDGYLGQTLMIVPSQRLVAVRQVRGGPKYNADTDGFGEFKNLVLTLLPN